MENIVQGLVGGGGGEYRPRVKFYTGCMILSSAIRHVYKYYNSH